MTLYEKIITLYPSLNMEDFMVTTGTIILQNDSDGKGDYIKSWNHPTLQKPTQQQLDNIN
jgi:hypothetical protein